MLPDVSADPPNNPTKLHTDSPPELTTTECPRSPIPSQFKIKAVRRFLKQQRHRYAQADNNDFFNVQITRAKDERTTWAKANLKGKQCAVINISHR